jgi:hypothetical protein
LLDSPSGPRPPHCPGFAITLRHTTLCRTPLGEWSARHRDLYLTTHNTHKRQTNIHAPRGIFFFLSRFFPLIHCVLLNPSVLLHVTLCSILVLIQQT